MFKIEFDTDDAVVKVTQGNEDSQLLWHDPNLVCDNCGESNVTEFNYESDKSQVSGLLYCLNCEMLYGGMIIKKQHLSRLTNKII